MIFQITIGLALLGGCEQQAEDSALEQTLRSEGADASIEKITSAGELNARRLQSDGDCTPKNGGARLMQVEVDSRPQDGSQYTAYYSYDEKRRPLDIRQVILDRNGKIVSELLNKRMYDEDGRMNATSLEDSLNLRSLRKFEYVYEKDRVITRTDNNGDGSIDLEHRRISYPDRKVTELDRGADGNVDVRTTKHLDKYGRVSLSEIDREADGKIDSTTRYSYAEKSRLVSHYAIDNDNDSKADVVVRFFYDANDLLIRKEEHRDGKLHNTVQTEYEGLGAELGYNIVEISRLAGESNWQSRTVREYSCALDLTD